MPKPLFPVLNIPALDRLIEKLKSEGIDEVAVNCHHLANQIEGWGKKNKDAILLRENILLDTGGAIKNAFDTLGWDKPLLVYNADIISNIPVKALLRSFSDRPGHEAMFCLHNHPQFNKVATKGDAICSFNSPGEDSLAYTGISVFSPDIFKDAPRKKPFPLIPYIQDQIKKGKRVGFCRAEELAKEKEKWLWHDIGTPRGYLDANLSLLSLSEKKNLVQDCTVHEDIKIDSGVVIGEASEISGSGTLKNVIIWPNSHVKIKEPVENCIFTPYGRVDIR